MRVELSVDFYYEILTFGIHPDEIIVPNIYSHQLPHIIVPNI
jgi:hypothetical protein